MEKSTLIWQKKLPTGYFEVYSTKPTNAITVKQIHTNTVISLVDAKNNILEADGIFWKWSDLNEHKLPTVLTADCLPIVLLGHEGGAILHAGWRGVQSQIYLHPEIAKLNPQYFFIGPSIQQKSFEVTSEFLDYFENKAFFTNQNNKYTFNLQQQAIFDLKQHYKNIAGEDCSIDTFTDLRFQSYRRDKKNRTNNYNCFTMND
jgi:copper oxidase (laccase) domain-containing protein